MSTTPADPRHRVRELAMQWLFAWELCRCPQEAPELPEDSLAAGPPETVEAARELLALVRQHLPAIDSALDQRLQNWTLGRLAAVDRAILRLAAYEILYRGEVSPRVAINEAIELAKAYGSDAKTARLVNGVLDRLARDHRPQDLRRPAAARPTTGDA
ncbi:MAG: transcription antitermination factor NusB [Planctomycetota bacterium]|nr:transcription antitermination factor NusB [Planctomycetota bacterium]MCX8039374.1 transcription antitermination factor NusB [Planctomycetota bacterium]MDW8373354.1 transcription antitermination factor NusB [Planctomycetota bacterium]